MHIHCVVERDVFPRVRKLDVPFLQAFYKFSDYCSA
jgi:hypothetical protein